MHEARSPNVPPLPGTTLERHIVDRQRSAPGAVGDFTGLFMQISLAAKIIHSRVHRAGLSDVLGLTGEVNVQGEEVAKMDIFANRALIKSVEAGGHVCVMASEEDEHIIPIPERYPAGKYVLLFDPLDGSGNIDINSTIGTIFSIHRRITEAGPGTEADCLQPGYKQVAAGYVIYGSSAILVYSDGEDVFGFTMDPQVGEFFLSHSNMQIPNRGNTYSINEGNRSKWNPGVREWAEWVKSSERDGGPAGLRYIGCMVADFHRTLLRGGVFAYPGSQSRPEGKLRLLYECAPLAFIAEAAGGVAIDEQKRRVLDLEPTELHQRTPLFIGSKSDIDDVRRFL